MEEGADLSPESGKKKPGKKKFLIFRLIAAVFIIVTVGVPLGFTISVYNDLPDNFMELIDNPKNDLSTQIYSSDGVLIRNLYDEKNRINVPLKDISEHAIHALIATEDARFKKHSGVDPIAFFAIAKGMLQGKKVRGGSTITMQLSRNLYDHVGKKRSGIRKLKEMIVSVLLERRYTKDEIITSYLNTVSFVGNSYGIQNASKIYFQKDAKELNIQESALLIGLLKGTGEYDPRRHPERSKNRRNTVLDLMHKHGFINATQVDTLKKTDLGIRYKKVDHNTGLAPYFTEHLRLWLDGWCDANGYNIYTDGLKVYTTIDSRFQTYAEEAMKEHLSSLQKQFSKHVTDREPWKRDTTMLWDYMRKCERYRLAKKADKTDEEIWAEFNVPREMSVFSWNGDIDTTFSPLDSIKYYSRFLETGFISMDPQTGYVKAWVGGINHEYFKYDHVYLGKRQVGSTFKPFVYTAAFEDVYSPCDEMLNQQVFFYDEKGQLKWAPKNADGKVGGKMTLRRGLATSTNLITARVMKVIGPERVCTCARQMGITSQLDCVPSLALGTTDLSVFELTGAYSTFANKGVWVEPTFLTRIEDRNGNIIYEKVSDKREAISAETAYMMLNMLMGVVREPGGTAGRIGFRYNLRNEIGGKTGTTQNQSDGWFMGVTPYLVSGTWVGCSDRRMRFRSLSLGQGASMALPVFGLYMQKVYDDSTIGLPKDPFPKPKNFGIELDCAKYQKFKKALNDEEGKGSDGSSILDFGS